ncbi:MAG TPA: hypothetical protein ENI17_11730 [Pseudomonas xinjiangensis]|uniref:SatD family (SatD) n=2 Tax=root TaxID=1 RepID=A0A7V1BMC8_9GAMM|nr:hypothetical protein [Halopseudomonas xinjiangensis]HEC48282.1 hypothetical protein [Halopseudomonas xinjiangensis]
MSISAVITGDLIDSQSAQDTHAYIAQLKATLDQLAGLFDFKAEQYRGDGFQLTLVAPERAFECAVLLRAGLIANSPEGERFDARIAIGIGAAPSENHYGGAFVLSGQGLDGMKKTTLGIFSHARQLLDRIELPTEFVAVIIEGWTRVEAETYFLHATQHASQKDLAKTLGKSRVTVHKALQRANAELIDRYLERTRAWIQELQDAR